MAKAILVARILLGLLFFVFGLNGILHFFALPTPTGDAGTMLGMMAAHGWLTFSAVLQVVAGLLLLVGRYVPLALVILGPIIGVILLFHTTMEPAGLPPGLIAAVLEVFLLWAYRLSFRGLFDAAPEVGRV